MLNASPCHTVTRRTGAVGSGPLVYVAEDDDDLRRLLMETLRHAGYEVLAAASGRDMLKLITAASRGEIPVPDAIVMDVRMPKCSGLDVLGALRAAEWRQPTVMITAFGDAALRAEAAGRGASVVLDKPFDVDDLVGVLDILLLFAAREGELDDEEEPPTLRSPVLSRLARAAAQ